MITLEQARELLGVEPDADPNTVRRAYLRRLKKTKPDRDPEGFQRLRDAYEQLAERASLVAPRADAPSVIDEPIRAAPEAEPEPEPEAEPEPEPVAAAPRMREPIALAMLDVAVALEERRWADARAPLERALSLAEQQLDLSGVDARLVVETTLRGFREREGQLVRAMYQRWWGQLGQLDGHMRLPTHTRTLALLVSELCALPDDFPREFSMLIAEALLRGEPEGEMAAIVYMVEQRPAAARKAVEQLYEHTDALYEIYHRPLDLAQPSMLEDSGRLDFLWPLFIILLVLLSAGFILHSCQS